MLLGVKAALVDGVLVDGDVRIEDGAIAAVGVQPAGAEGTPCPGSWTRTSTAWPGSTSSPPSRWLRARRRGAGDHRRRGLPADLRLLTPRRLHGAAEAVAEGAQAGGGGPLIVGVHLEGPSCHRVARRPRPGAPAGAGPRRRRVARDRRPVTMMTVAPELPGGLELVADARRAGASWCRAGTPTPTPSRRTPPSTPARARDHPRAQRPPPLAPRDPGIGGVALVRPDVSVQAIVDGVHLAPESAYGAFLAAGDALLPRHRCDRGRPAGRGRLRAGRPAGDDQGRRRAPARRHARGQRADNGRGDAQPRRGRRLARRRFARRIDGAGPPARRDDLGALRPGAPAHVAVVDDELQVLRTWSPAPRLRPWPSRRRDLAEARRVVGVEAAAQRHGQRELVRAHRRRGSRRAASGRPAG